MQVAVTTSGIGLIEDAQLLLLECPFRDLREVLHRTGSLRALASFPVARREELNQAELLSPVGGSGAVWVAGLNYLSKAKASGRRIPSEPNLYLTAPSAIGSPGGRIEHDTSSVAELDYEGEIALVIGRRTSRITSDAEAWEAIGAVSAAIDFTARDVMRSTGNPTLAKSFEGFTPIGASAVGTHDLPDRHSIRVRTWRNDELVQDDSSDQMIFPIPELVRRISWLAVLEVGDVVLTGTPAGTGQETGSFLDHGDEIRVEVDGVLPLTTVVAHRPRPGRSGRDGRTDSTISN